MVMTGRLGRLLCWMRIRTWRSVTVIDRFDLTGVTVRPDQFEALRTAFPPPEPKPFEMPWEAGIRRLTQVPVWLGGSAVLHGRVLRSHKEERCRHCDRPR